MKSPENNSNLGNDPSLRPIFRGRLTRKTLMDLPEGILLQSNVYLTPLLSKFERYLGPIETRESTWQQMKQLRVDGRLFNGYATEESYDFDFMGKLSALPFDPSAVDRNWSADLKGGED